MKNTIKDYFNFSGSERKGILILLSILLLLILIWKIIPLIKPEDYSNPDKFEKEIIEFEKSIIQKDSVSDYPVNTNPTSRLFTFNPNNMSDSNWFALGLTFKQVISIRHFQEKGGIFTTKEDFKKMYCLKPGQYDLLEPYIEIPSQNKTETVLIEKRHINIQLNEFDPNCTSRENWKAFGLSEKQINIIEKFLSMGGKFKTKEDFKKMYCIQPQLYYRLEPYISITTETVKLQKYDPDVRVDLNTADSAGFMKIKGISPYLARSIVKFRNALGGFIHKKQILEVWGFKNITYINVEKNLILSEIPIKKLNLNTATFAELLKHPYLNYDLTKAIFQYKKIAGKIKTIQELTINKIIPDTTIYKIKPYILTE